MMLRFSRAVLRCQPQQQQVAITWSKNAARCQFPLPAITAAATFYHGTPERLEELPPVRRSRLPGTGPASQTTTKPDSNDANIDENATTSPSPLDRISPNQHSPVTEPDKFLRAAEAVLDKVQTAVEPMQRKNDVFVVTKTIDRVLNRHCLTIELQPDHGTYRIHVDTDRQRLLYTSPMSGQWSYILSDQTGEWVGESDGHSFEGMLVRDLNRQCLGLPDL